MAVWAPATASSRIPQRLQRERTKTIIISLALHYQHSKGLTSIRPSPPGPEALARQRLAVA